MERISFIPAQARLGIICILVLEDQYTCAGRPRDHKKVLLVLPMTEHVCSTDCKAYQHSSKFGSIQFASENSSIQIKMVMLCIALPCFWLSMHLFACSAGCHADDKRMVVMIDSWQADSMYPAGHYVCPLGTTGDKEAETKLLLSIFRCSCDLQAATLMDKRMVVVIDSWQADSMYPAGHYVRTLGVIGDKETETEVLLIENDINTSPFSPAVHACVPPLPWSVTQADLDDPNR